MHVPMGQIRKFATKKAISDVSFKLRTNQINVTLLEEEEENVSILKGIIS